MAIHYEIHFDDSGDPDCDAWDERPIEVHLVQHDIVKYPGPRDDFVEEIVVYYTGASNTMFTLKVWDTSYTLTSPTTTLLDGSGGATSNGVTAQTTHYQWSCTAPTNTSTTLFEFDDGSGPPAKLKVKVKKQESFSC